jgi:hypothetical protein
MGENLRAMDKSGGLADAGVISFDLVKEYRLSARPERNSNDLAGKASTSQFGTPELIDSSPALSGAGRPAGRTDNRQSEPGATSRSEAVIFSLPPIYVGYDNSHNAAVAGDARTSQYYFGFNSPDGKTIWQELSGLLGGHVETSEDKLRTVVVDLLMPSERKAFELENNSLAAWESRKFLQSVAAAAGLFTLPARPETPMHDEIERRVKLIEQLISLEVRADMTDNERQRLDSQLEKYKNGPAGQEPPNAVKDYLDKLDESVRKYVKENEVVPARP